MSPRRRDAFTLVFAWMNDSNCIDDEFSIRVSHDTGFPFINHCRPIDDHYAIMRPHSRDRFWAAIIFTIQCDIGWDLGRQRHCKETMHCQVTQFIGTIIECLSHVYITWYHHGSGMFQWTHGLHWTCHRSTVSWEDVWGAYSSQSGLKFIEIIVLLIIEVTLRPFFCCVPFDPGQPGSINDWCRTCIHIFSFSHSDG